MFRRLLIPVCFTATIFLSASLLFFVQPLFAKIALPVVGGGPAVWTTAMLFFQIVLIGGYLYAHFLSKLHNIFAQVTIHMALWAIALMFLPPELPEDWALNATGAVAPQILFLFAIGVGAPFALLSSNAPLIQAWYSRSDGPSSDDPYFLYGASNTGSLLSLLSFPLLAEPLLGAGQIAWGFSVGFVVLGIGLLASGLLGRRSNFIEANAVTRNVDAPDMNQIGYWLLLAFIPSSLMLAITSKISADIGAVPLVWVIPLALYLLSFVISFNERLPLTANWFSTLSKLAILGAIALTMNVSNSALSTVSGIALVAAFFVIAVWAHHQLYRVRPNAGHLTVFYVTMSVGGALGGLFNSIIAPWAFNALYEAPLTLLVALILIFQANLKLTLKSFSKGAVLGLILTLGIVAVTRQFGLGNAILAALMIVGGFIATAFLRKTFGAWVVAVICVMSLPSWLISRDNFLFADRSFFGSHQVLERDGVRFYLNGTTIHGSQSATDLGQQPKPLSYYHHLGPMGQVLASKYGAAAGRIGVVGLGVGSLACYARPGQDWHFYEIDTMVDRVARDTNLFTFLSVCAPDAPTHLGDARIVLQSQADLKFDILILDAYSSNAVPVHLTTLDAMAMYFDRLNQGGILVFHTSNRYYDIQKVLARSAEELGHKAWLQKQSSDFSDDPGFRGSHVVMISHETADVAELLEIGAWKELPSDGGAVWTDDKANPLSILKRGVLWK